MPKTIRKAGCIGLHPRRGQHVACDRPLQSRHGSVHVSGDGRNSHVLTTLKPTIDMTGPAITASSAISGSAGRDAADESVAIAAAVAVLDAVIAVLIGRAVPAGTAGDPGQLAAFRRGGLVRRLHAGQEPGEAEPPDC